MSIKLGSYEFIALDYHGITSNKYYKNHSGRNQLERWYGTVIFYIVLPYEYLKEKAIQSSTLLQIIILVENKTVVKYHLYTEIDLLHKYTLIPLF